jgi:uncharacterized membrane protein YeaQ/YmgE (transglycosylase-associated protein family)
LQAADFVPEPGGNGKAGRWLRKRNVLHHVPIRERFDALCSVGRSGGAIMQGPLIVYCVLTGIVAGVVGRWLMHGRDPGGFVVTILIGIVGSLLGGLIGQVYGHAATGRFPGLTGAAAGAIVVLALYWLVVTRRTR